MKITGMRSFIVIWIGQSLSRVGSILTSFALGIWAFDQTKQATTLTTMGFLIWGGSFLASTFAGVLIDRWNRKFTMIIADMIAMATTGVILLLYATDNLQIWHLFVQAALLGVGEAFQGPAFSAAITTMLKKEDYERAFGLSGIAENITVIFAPPLAAVAMTVMPLERIMLIDFLTFIFAISGVLLVTIPRPQVSAEGEAASKEPFRQQFTFGLRYIFRRPPLLGLMLIIIAYIVTNDFGGGNLTTPMVLARSGGDGIPLGITQAAFGIGGILGGLLLTAKGGFKNRAHGLFLGICGQCGGYALMGLGQSTIVWALGSFCSAFSVVVAQAASGAFWQSKVPPDIQGKVFSARRTLALSILPFIILSSGPLADRVFEPMMASGTSLVHQWFGTGPGAGMGLQMFIFGILGALAGLSGFLFKVTRDADKLLPDHTQPAPEDANVSAEGAVTVPAG